MQKRHVTKEFRQKCRERNLKLWRDPAFREKQHSKDYYDDPEYQKHQSEIRTASWNDPKYRAKQKRARQNISDEWRAAISEGRRGIGKYEDCDRSALINFQGCHNRVRDGKVSEIEWPRTRDGYIAFLKEIGPKPNDGQKWSVGRIEHDLGYIEGNVMWELHRINSGKTSLTNYTTAQEKRR